MDSAREAASWVLRRLRAIGYEVGRLLSVEASREAIEAALRTALSEADLVVVVGGVERGSARAFEAVASALGRQLVEDEEARRAVEEYYYFAGVEGGGGPPEGFRTLYTVPEGSIVLRNPKGPAPGIFLDEGGKYLLCVPGALGEASTVVEEEADQYLRELLGARFSASVHVMTESWDEEELQQVAEGISEAAPWAFAEVKHSVFSRGGWGVTVTVFAREPSELSEKLVRAVELVEEELRKRGIACSKKSMNELL